MSVFSLDARNQTSLYTGSRLYGHHRDPVAAALPQVILFLSEVLCSFDRYHAGEVDNSVHVLLSICCSFGPHPLCFFPCDAWLSAAVVQSQALCYAGVPPFDPATVIFSNSRLRMWLYRYACSIAALVGRSIGGSIAIENLNPKSGAVDDGWCLA